MKAERWTVRNRQIKDKIKEVYRTRGVDPYTSTLKDTNITGLERFGIHAWHVYLILRDELDKLILEQ